MPPLKPGDRVWVSAYGQRVAAVVETASDNGASVILSFDALFHLPEDGAYVGSMPVLRTGDTFVEIARGTPVVIEPMEP